MLDSSAIAAAIESEQDSSKVVRLNRLARLASGEKLSEIARTEKVSPQIIMRDRRTFVRKNCL